MTVSDSEVTSRRFVVELLVGRSVQLAVQLLETAAMHPVEDQGHETDVAFRSWVSRYWNLS